MHDVLLRQPDRDITRRGPALKAAFDANGKPTKPALGFARSWARPEQVSVAETVNSNDRNPGSSLALL